LGLMAALVFANLETIRRVHRELHHFDVHQRARWSQPVASTTNPPSARVAAPGADARPVPR
jgi:hypothetical protein